MCSGQRSRNFASVIPVINDVDYKMWVSTWTTLENKWVKATARTNSQLNSVRSHQYHGRTEGNPTQWYLGTVLQISNQWINFDSSSSVINIRRVTYLQNERIREASRSPQDVSNPVLQSSDVLAIPVIEGVRLLRRTWESSNGFYFKTRSHDNWQHTCVWFYLQNFNRTINATQQNLTFF